MALALAGALLGAGLVAGCALLPPLNYRIVTLPLSPSEGWVQLPVARWLVNPGIDADAILFCPREACAEGVVARLTLSGRERDFADRLAADPAAALARARPTSAPKRPSSQPPRAAVSATPLAIAGWKGGLVRVGSATRPGRAAHLVIVTRREGESAALLISIAADAGQAERQARQALE
jgi:hypothetical protein